MLLMMLMIMTTMTMILIMNVSSGCGVAPNVADIDVFLLLLLMPLPLSPMLMLRTLRWSFQEHIKAKCNKLTGLLSLSHFVSARFENAKVSVRLVRERGPVSSFDGSCYEHRKQKGSPSFAPSLDSSVSMTIFGFSFPLSSSSGFHASLAWLTSGGAGEGASERCPAHG